jgi:hypothetical protein
VKNKVVPTGTADQGGFRFSLTWTLEAVSRPVTLESISFLCGQTATYNVDVYYTTFDFVASVGATVRGATWTKLPAISAPCTAGSPLTMTVNIPLVAGRKTGISVTSDGIWRHSIDAQQIPPTATPLSIQGEWVTQQVNYYLPAVDDVSRASTILDDPTAFERIPKGSFTFTSTCT